MLIMVRQCPEHLKRDADRFLLDLPAQVDEIVRVHGEMGVDQMQAWLAHCEQALERINKGRTR